MRRSILGVFVASGAMLSLWAGTSCQSPVNFKQSTLPATCQQTPPLLPPVKTDILFMIDNSNSMADKQDEIANDLPTFVSELQKGAGLVNDFQVGVITSSVYQNAYIGPYLTYQAYPDQSGRLQAVPVVAADGGLRPGTEKVLRVDDPQLVDKFKLLVHQGIGGSGQETPFEALRLALTPPLTGTPLEQGGNQGFLRDGARLLIVLVTDDDDCSENVRPPRVWVTNGLNVDDCHNQAVNLTPVSDYFQVFSSLTNSDGSKKDVIWASLAPVGRTHLDAQQVLETNDAGAPVLHCADCPDSEGTGFRHQEMASDWDSSLHTLGSVCWSSYHDWLLNIAQVANTTQSAVIGNVPDASLLQVRITRADGSVQLCTQGNGGISYEPSSDLHSGIVHFQAQCLRTATDTKVDVQLLCAG